MERPADFVLMRCKLGDPSLLAQAAARWCAETPVPMTLHRAAWDSDTRTACVYARLTARAWLGEGAMQVLSGRWLCACQPALEVSTSRLELVFDARGASHGEAPRFHYVVETTPEEGWLDEIGRWYDSEHMPGLAAVPGCIHARRLINHDQGPLSLACYDLVTQETLGSPPWLAVRNTAWSDVARPHFTDTRRTMLKVFA